MNAIPGMERKSVGKEATAQALAERAQRSVSAYRQFLEGHGFSPGGAFGARPVMDKANYIATYPYDQLLGEDVDQTFTVFKSSGSSGRSYYWPQLRSTHLASSHALRAFLEDVFAVHQRKTLAIIGLALGSWIGGEHSSWVLKNMALHAPYPFSVFSPGSCHDEIIDMARRASRFVDQILLVVCPSAIGHILLRAEQSKRPLPLEKIRYLVLGEPFPEHLRSSLQRRAGLAQTKNLMFSVYGSADTGTLGVESPASVALRKLVSSTPALADAFGCSAETVPHFFHGCAPDAYLETVAGELLVTRWQGVPLVRYNLHDRARLYGWSDVRSGVLDAMPEGAEGRPLWDVIERAGAGLPDLIAIAGRTDACLILCGTNLTEDMLDAAVRCEALVHLVSGLYKGRILHEGDRQYLALDLELCPGVRPDRSTLDTVYESLMQSLGREQPEFYDDWRNVYSLWDSDPDRRILRLNLVPWPALSQHTETQIKHRGTRG